MFLYPAAAVTATVLLVGMNVAGVASLPGADSTSHLGAASPTCHTGKPHVPKRCRTTSPSSPTTEPTSPTSAPTGPTSPTSPTTAPTSPSSSTTPPTSPTSPTSPTTPPTPPSSTPTGPWACTGQGYGAVCGPYGYPGITNSNGYNTYVTDDCWANPQCPYTLQANDPGHWQVVAREDAGNTGVRSYPDAQQLMTNWTGAGWGPCGSCTDTPISGLSQLTSSYTEVTPRGGTIAQFAWDIWTNNNTGHPGEIMVWVDNSGRGAGGATQVGTATIAGQAWTIYEYGSGELIWSLGAPGTFDQQGSGTVDLLAILQESIRQGFTSPQAMIGQVNAGWEICSTGGIDETFSVSRYTLTGAAR